MRSKRLLLTLAALLVEAGLPALARVQQTASNGPSTAPNEVPAGTRFLVGLQGTLSSKDDKPGKEFKARTLEPLVTADGTVLPPGAEVHGHIDKVEPAHETGRARIWLTFEDIETPNGWIPLVAVVSDVPGVHSLKVAYDQEGEIESRSNKRQRQAEAAAAGALVGAAPGVAARSGKDAAIGAAAGAVTAFMITSGLGQELILLMNTKLELTLERPLYFGRT